MCSNYNTDDTVIYHADKNLYNIENILNKVLANISDYLEQSELIINLNKGKTESMLFGTAKRLSKQTNGSLSIKYRDIPIKNTIAYDYLGNTLDPTLNLGDNFKKKFKKVTGRIRLFTKIRPFLTTSAAEQIYNTMIVPIMTYCGSIQLSTSRTQQTSLAKIDRRASTLIYGKTSSKLVKSTYGKIKKQACIIVRKCLNEDVCSPMKCYFQINDNNRVTRNNKLSIRLPKIRLEVGRKTFYYSGAKLYNTLPLEIRKIISLDAFKKQLSTYFQ